MKITLMGPIFHLYFHFTDLRKWKKYCLLLTNYWCLLQSKFWHRPRFHRLSDRTLCAMLKLSNCAVVFFPKNTYIWGSKTMQIQVFWKTSGKSWQHTQRKMSPPSSCLGITVTHSDAKLKEFLLISFKGGRGKEHPHISLWNSTEILMLQMCSQNSQ